MLVLLSSSLKFHAKPVTELVVQSTPRFAQKARELASELKVLEAKEIKKHLAVNDAVAKVYIQSLGKFESMTPVPACSLYDGAIYTGLAAPEMEEDDAEWANHHIRILSGIYGLVRPFDAIQPLSLPVTLGTKLTTSKGKFLRDYWAESIANSLDESLRKLPRPLILNCAHEEDSSVLNPSTLPEGTRITNVQFKIRDRNEAAEATGELIRWIMENRCQNFEDLLTYRGMVEEDEEAVYRIKPCNDDNTIIFEEKVSDGGSGNWARRMAESGMSRKAYVKEHASGKNRYKRSEMNKSMAKEKKKERGKHVVF
mmetsp:Transcript_7765/g.16832  ORF Transcript_7765/g.16832 Transcript_7765/m.16832 type:complete len:312 (+) Transcript_7765:74-1009(+)